MFNYSMAGRATKATIDCALKATKTVAAERTNVMTGIYQDMIYISCPECSLMHIGEPEVPGHSWPTRTPRA